MSSLTKPRVAVDTNVVISAVLWGGKSGLIIKSYQQNRFILLISPFILAELTNFLENYQIESKERRIILKEFSTKPLKINPPKRVSICRDQKDNQILDLCLAGRADFLVTGDKDLLVLKSFRKTEIIKPREFLRFLRR